jgi:Cys-tRNA(Pro) deacylase
MNVEQYLKNKEVDFEIITFNQIVHSVQDVQRVCNCEASETIKTLVFIGSIPIIVIIPGDKRANIKKIEEFVGEQGLRMAKPEEVKKITGYNVGSVSPFGIDSKIKQIADDSIHSLSSLFLGSGESNVLIKMNQIEFTKAFRGIFASISD